MERKEKIDQIVRDRERQKMEIQQKRWSKKEESDFYRTVSTFGVQRYVCMHNLHNFEINR